ncbi:MAG: ABC transporter permease [Actinobacteria bacterium]|nr:ABC transporter permease [Actinomycetota bacterium]
MNKANKLSIFLKRNRVIFLSYAIALLMLIIVSILRPGFGSVSHLKIIAIESAILGIIAVGQTFVIITGGIDLSVPLTVNIAAIFLTRMSAGQNINLFIIILITLFGATIVGVINGLGVSYLKIPPIIMTLGMNSILTGGLLGITSGTYGGNAPPIIRFLANGNVKQIPFIFIFWVFIIVIVTIILSHSPLGKRFYAIGNNEMVAIFSGVNVRVNKLIAYSISGFASGLGGIILVGDIGQSYLGMGDPFLFLSITAVAIGGASILGGSGNYLGTVAGAFILIILTGLLPAFKMPTSAQQIVYGLALLIAVIATRNQVVGKR